MKTVKLIALDLDGTLISEDQRISFKDAQAIKRAQSAGIPVVIATGRLFPSTRAWLSALQIHTPVILCNGADIREGTKTVYSSTIDPGRLREVYGAAGSFEGKRYVYCRDRIYCTKEDYDEILFGKWGKKEIEAGLVVYCAGPDEIFRSAGEEAIKFVIRTPDDSQHDAIGKMACNLDYFDMVKGEAMHIEFTRRGTHKGEALQRVAEGMGISMEDVLTVGDSMNDYEMIRAAGVGVAMGNAMREVKRIADDITLPVWENGVSHALSRHVFGEEESLLEAFNME